MKVNCEGSQGRWQSVKAGRHGMARGEEVVERMAEKQTTRVCLLACGKRRVVQLHSTDLIHA